MHSTTKLGTVALAATALVVLAGCSGGAGGSSENELVIWMPTQEDSQGEAITALIDEFETQNPDVTVTLEQRSVDEHKNAMRQAAGTNAGPDIYWYWEGSGLGGELVNVGMSLDLTDYYEQYGWKDRFTPASMAGITQYDGFHGVPWSQQGEGIYYNKTLFEQAGITEAPTTYEGLVDAAEKLKAAGITPIEFGGTVNWDVMRLLDSLIETECGADVADKLNTADGDWAAEKCVTAAFTELKTWGDNYFNDGYLGINNDDAAQLFFSGQAAMSLEGTWYNSQVVDNGLAPENIGILMFPTGTDRLYGFGEAFYVNAASKKADLAATFLDFGTSEEGQAIVDDAWAALSVNKDVPVNDTNPLNAIWADLFNQAQGVYTNNDQNFTTAETTEYWRIQNSVLTGDIAPADAGAEFQKFRDAQ
ncbi:ABC transporter substrate-binding protein [Microbacterium sp. Bi128]|uniref:ABC transporter substrate-binding protein n=1 Tax=Microbacterium sp. Bi128 TaxID=2821115 RepID=UPI001DE99DD9|nr:extracellular solute-binding protein [Microbacterium sp. Bi128]CAH0140317.1 Multiple sugar-binding protein [Microbacterium sp. Bi128]